VGRKSAFLQSGPAPGFEVVVVVFCAVVEGPGGGGLVAGEVVVGFGVVAHQPDVVVLGGRSQSGRGVGVKLGVGTT